MTVRNFRLLSLLLLVLAAIYGQIAPAASVTGRVDWVVGTNPPPPFTLVAAAATNGALLDSTSCDPSGNYSLNVSTGAPVLFLAIPYSGHDNQGYSTHEYTIPFTRSVITGDRHIDFRMNPALELILRGTNAGVPLAQENVLNLFVTDPALRTRPIWSGAVEHTNGVSPSLVSVNLPTGTGYVVRLQWRLPHAGHILVEMDNGGAGYVAAGSTSLFVNVNREIAATAVRKAGEAIAAATNPVPSPVSAGFAQATNAFALADYDEAAGLAIVAREELMLDASRRGIEAFRKGNLAIRVCDADGHPVPGAAVHIQPLKRDFLFGTFDQLQEAGSNLYLQAFADGFNFNTAGFYWTESEPTDNDYQWDQLDNRVGVVPLSDMGYTLKAHPIICFSPTVTPGYVWAMDYPARQAECRDHVTNLVNHYKARIPIWEAVNEAHGYPAMGGMTREQITAITREAVDLIHQCDSNALVSINSGVELFGQQILGEATLPDRPVLYSLPAYDYIQDLLTNGVKLDIIGLQLYNGGCVTLFRDLGLSTTVDPVFGCSLNDLSEYIERMGSLGLPIHLTEQSVSGGMALECPTAGYWREPWSETNQARFAEAYYTMGFGSRAVRSITWWDLSDTYSFIYLGGLVRTNGEPKPVYHTLTNLFARWSTRTNLLADTQGDAAIRAFGGTYRVDVSIGSWTNTAEVHLPEQTNQTLDVTMTGFLNPRLDVSAGSNGTASPTGTVYAVYAGTQSVALLPDLFYDVADALLNGTTATNQLVDGGDGSYRLDVPDFTTNQTLAITFRAADDEDTDGLPDKWELRYAPALTNMSDLTDSDLDGLLDWQEYVAGTCPTDSLSCLRIILNNPAPAAPSDLVLSWLPATNRTYRVQSTTNPLVPFSDLSAPIPAAFPTNHFTHTIPADAPVGLFRIRTDSMIHP